MSRVVYLHIGAPKTGTTYLQSRLALNAASLGSHGVHFPNRSRLTNAATFHFRAALDLLGQDWGGAPGHAEGAWDALVRRVRRLDGTVVISHEILAPASAQAVARVMADLAGSEIHIVYSARDLARQLPAAWQESVKQGRRWTFRRFLRKAVGGRVWFMRAMDLPTILQTWGEGIPAERIHVVTVPPPGGSRDELWHRFCAAFAIDPDWAPRESERSNRSMGIAETHLVRMLNRGLDRQLRRTEPFDVLVRDLLAEQLLAHRTGRPVRLPPGSFPWADEQAERWVEWVRDSGVQVHGDLEDLRPVRPEENTPWLDPDRPKGKQVNAVALDALVAMTEEAASRPSPEGTFAGRARRVVRRAGTGYFGRARSSRSA